MIPPKKSKAARENTKDLEPTENGDPKGGASDVDDEPPPPKKSKPVNIFKEPLVEGKRAKTVSPVEALLFTWINENLEAKPGFKVQKNDSYKCYLASCADKAVNGVDQGRFLRAVDETLPEGHTVSEKSAYKRKMKEVRKVKKRRELAVKGETLKIKMKDIITGALQDLGNPKKGVRFHAIKKYIAAHFPALQIDYKPESLKTALNRGVYYGTVILVKGIGKAGYYRLPGKAGDEDEEDKEKAKGSADGEKKEKKEKKEKGEDGEEEEKEEVKPEEDGETPKEEEADSGKRKKRKAAEKAKAGVTKDKKKKKKGKKSAQAKKSRKFIIHSDPLKVQDCFPLAFTYMSEPKQTSVFKIKKYVKKYYNMKGLDDRLPKVLNDGLEKGWWSHVSGSKAAGIYRLEMSEYDATADDDLIGMVMNAMVACTEPKICSSRILKDYIMEYHPDMKIAEKPFLFKNALQRACRDGTLQQVSGLGAGGSFKFTQSFIASPIVLQGADDKNDYDSDGNELLDEPSDDESDEEEQPDVAVYFDAYVPRPAKKRGHARSDAAGIALYTDHGDLSTSANRVIPKDHKIKRNKQTAKKPGRGRPPGPADKKKKKKKETEEPSSSKKRKQTTPAAFDSNRKTSGRSRKRVSYTEDDRDEVTDEEDATDEEPEDEPEEPKKKSGKSASKEKAKSSPSKGKKGKKSKGKRG